MIERRRQVDTQTGSPQSSEQREWHFIPRLPILFILQSMSLLYSLYWCRRQRRRWLYLPPFVLQWERECTADALLSAARPASEQCIGLMQCSCVLTHSTSPPPVCLLHPPSAATISIPRPRSRLVPHVLRPSPPSFTFTVTSLMLLFSRSPTSSPPLRAVGKTEALHPLYSPEWF